MASIWESTVIEVQPGFVFKTAFLCTSTGVTPGVQILDRAGVVVRARKTTGIIESPAGSGRYVTELVAPYTAGFYDVVWDDGAQTPGHIGTDDLEVTPQARTDF